MKNQKKGSKLRVSWLHLTSPKGEGFQGFWIVNDQNQPVGHERPFATAKEARIVLKSSASNR